MKKIVAMFLVALLALTAVCSGMAITQEEARKIASSVVNTTTDQSLVTSPFINVIQAVKPSVVGINNYQTYTYSNYNPYYGFGSFGFGYGYGGYNGYNNSPREAVERLAATGSGVVVYDGVVVTNYHVVEDASRLSISTLDSEEEFDCTLITYDEAADVAVVYAPDLKLAPVPLGDSDQLQVGEWAICIGNPLSNVLRGTTTVGIISALDRQINSTTTTDKYGLKRTVTNSMIQTDAAINSGNSGGGLFNVLGQLMGIPSQKLSNSYYSSSATIEGIGLAIPVNTAKPLIEEAIIKIATQDLTTSGKKDESTPTTRETNTDKPMLGVTVSAITSNNNYMVYAGQLPSGLLISEIVENGPAAAAGIHSYDIIVEVDDKLADSTARIREALDQHGYGDTIHIKVYRVDGLAEAQSAGDLGEGSYIDFDVTLFEFNTAA